MEVTQLLLHLVVDVNMDGVMVPMEFARDGQIVLNISSRAVVNLTLGNNKVQFNARFSGVPRQVVVPMEAVLVIYAIGNGASTMFEPRVAYEQLALADANSAKDSTTEAVISVIDSNRPDNEQADNLEDEPPTPLRGGGRLSLRVVH